MRKERNTVSARRLGLLALPDACERCFWLHQKIGEPPTPFPGIFSTIDSYSKKVLQAVFQEHQRMPEWFEQFGLNGIPCPTPHHSWFKISHGSLMLNGSPDEVLKTPDGSLIIIDYKTARFKSDDPLRPLYEVQLNVYARIAEKLSPPRDVFPNKVVMLGLMYYDPLTEEVHPGKISSYGFLMEFQAHWVPIERRDAWIDELLARAEEILSKPEPPEGAADCKTCKAYHSIAAALPRIW
jgi:hypothetical protein